MAMNDGKLRCIAALKNRPMENCLRAILDNCARTWWTIRRLLEQVAVFDYFASIMMIITIRIRRRLERGAKERAGSRPRGGLEEPPITPRLYVLASLSTHTSTSRWTGTQDV